MVKPEELMEMYKDFVKSRPPTAHDEAYFAGFHDAERLYLSRMNKLSEALKTVLCHLSCNQ